MTAAAAIATHQAFPDYYCDLAGDGIFIDYCVTPPQIPGRPPFVLRYHDGWQTLNFERQQIRSTFVADLGWSLSVTTHELGEAGSVTATIHFPTVATPTGGGEIPVQTMLILNTHEVTAVPTPAGRRDHYRITALTGRAQKTRLY
jgi:hypothetical protein